MRTGCVPRHVTDRVRQIAPLGARLLAGLLLLGAVVLPTAHRIVGHTDALPPLKGAAVEDVHAVCALCATVLVAVVPAALALVVAERAVPFADAVVVAAGVPTTHEARGRAPPVG